MRVGSGTGPFTTAPVRLAVSTISSADWSISGSRTLQPDADFLLCTCHFRYLIRWTFAMTLIAPIAMEQGLSLHPQRAQRRRRVVAKVIE